jgi:hypothetical protein
MEFATHKRSLIIHADAGFANMDGRRTVCPIISIPRSPQTIPGGILVNPAKAGAKLLSSNRLYPTADKPTDSSTNHRPYSIINNSNLEF